MIGSDYLNFAIDIFKQAFNLDWGSITYKRNFYVIEAAVFIAAAFLIIRLIRWSRKRRGNSYYHVSLSIRKSRSVGFVYRTARNLVWLTFFMGLLFLGIALSDPVFIIADKTYEIQSREIIYVNDVSASNGFKVQNMNISRGELGRRTLEELLIKRKDKKDRAAYVVFATQSEIWSGFTTSFESLFFTISMSPIAMAPSDANLFWPGIFVLKKDQYLINDLDYETNLHFGLQSALYLFEKKGLEEITKKMKDNPGARMRSVIIITDGAADVDPEPQFKELRNSGVIPYLIFVDPSREAERKLYGDNNLKSQLPQSFLAMIRRYGGQYFFARNDETIDQISSLLDRLQGVQQVENINTREEQIYFIPLSLSFIFFMSALISRIIMFRVWRMV